MLQLIWGDSAISFKMNIIVDALQNFEERIINSSHARPKTFQQASQFQEVKGE